MRTPNFGGEHPICLVCSPFAIRSCMPLTGCNAKRNWLSIVRDWPNADDADPMIRMWVSMCVCCSSTHVPECKCAHAKHYTLYWGTHTPTNKIRRVRARTVLLFRYSSFYIVAIGAACPPSNTCPPPRRRSCPNYGVCVCARLRVCILFEQTRTYTQSK